MKSAILDSLRRWQDYSGRSNRSQFWWFALLFLVGPLISLIPGILGVLVGSFLNAPRAIVLIISFGLGLTYLLLVPAMLSVSVRRLHDVGKSGWFMLVPLYNLYLYVQPSFEKGRMPNWILAERVSLGCVGILIPPLFTGEFEENIPSILLWLAIYFLIRRKNKSLRKSET